MTWGMIRDKRKTRTMLDTLEEEYEAREEAYDVIDPEVLTASWDLKAPEESQEEE